MKHTMECAPFFVYRPEYSGIASAS